MAQKHDKAKKAMEEPSETEHLRRAIVIRFNGTLDVLPMSAEEQAKWEAEVQCPAEANAGARDARETKPHRGPKSKRAEDAAAEDRPHSARALPPTVLEDPYILVQLPWESEPLQLPRIDAVDFTTAPIEVPAIPALPCPASPFIPCLALLSRAPPSLTLRSLPLH